MFRDLLRKPPITELAPVRGFVKFLAWVVTLLCAFSLLGGLAIMIYESAAPSDYLLLLPVVIMLHVTGSIALTGYAPSYLLFTHGPRD